MKTLGRTRFMGSLEPVANAKENMVFTGFGRK